MGQDLTIATDRPEKRASCRACNWSPWLDEDEPAEHSCRSKPTTPRTTIEDRTRAALAVYTQRELRIRSERIADINLAHRGRS